MAKTNYYVSEGRIEEVEIPQAELGRIIPGRYYYELKKKDTNQTDGKFIVHIHKGKTEIAQIVWSDKANQPVAVVVRNMCFTVNSMFILSQLCKIWNLIISNGKENVRYELVLTNKEVSNG